MEEKANHEQPTKKSSSKMGVAIALGVGIHVMLRIAEISFVYRISPFLKYFGFRISDFGFRISDFGINSIAVQKSFFFLSFLHTPAP